MKSSVIEPFFSLAVNLDSTVTSLPSTNNGLFVALSTSLPFTTYSLPTIKSLYSTLSWIVTVLEASNSLEPSALFVAVVLIKGSTNRTV
ncbi:Uncharacterised protein [Streptococcus pneumoniae]|nr:Uncharacterised protein [Streptococcus pneumoniae]CRG01951.1 Uncharacterised protein [Streptococcus pneumoniae]